MNNGIGRHLRDLRQLGNRYVCRTTRSFKIPAGSVGGGIYRRINLLSLEARASLGKMSRIQREEFMWLPTGSLCIQTRAELINSNSEDAWLKKLHLKHEYSHASKIGSGPRMTHFRLVCHTLASTDWIYFYRKTKSLNRKPSAGMTHILLLSIGLAFFTRKTNQISSIGTHTSYQNTYSNIMMSLWQNTYLHPHLVFPNFLAFSIAPEHSSGEPQSHTLSSGEPPSHIAAQCCYFPFIGQPCFFKQELFVFLSTRLRTIIASSLLSYVYSRTPQKKEPFSHITFTYHTPSFIIMSIIY